MQLWCRAKLFFVQLYILNFLFSPCQYFVINEVIVNHTFPVKRFVISCLIHFLRFSLIFYIGFQTEYSLGGGRGVRGDFAWGRNSI